MSVFFVWFLVIAGLSGGIAAPFLTNSHIKSVAAHVVGWIWWFFFAYIICQLVTAIVVMATGKAIVGSVALSAVLNIVMYIVWFAVMSWLPLRRWKNQRKKTEEGKKLSKESKISPRQFVLNIAGLNRKPNLGDVKKYATTFPMYFLTLVVASFILTLIMGAETMNQQQNTGFATVGQTPFMLVIIGFCLVVLAPLCEEALFRGVLFTKLRDKLKFWPAALLTAGIFALVHGQFNVGVMAFILALYSAILREKTGAIWSSIFLHATQNLIAFLLTYIFIIG
jgi:membrane protease YdiL (CAAX protease family)